MTFVPAKYVFDADEPRAKPPCARLRLRERDVAFDVDVVEIDRAEAKLPGQADVVDASRVEADDAAAHGVEGHLVVTHDDELQVEGKRCEHPPLAGDDRVDGDELWLDDVLQIGDLLVQLVIVVDQAMPVVLDTDVVLHAERDGRPGMRLELGTVDEEVGLRHRLGGEERVAQAPRVIERDLDLRHLLEVIRLRAGSLEHGIEAGMAEGEAGRHGDPAALADGELLEIRTRAAAKRAQHALEKLRPGVRVRELRARGHAIRLHERPTVRSKIQSLEAFADDRLDSIDVVVRAGADDDSGSSHHTSPSAPLGLTPLMGRANRAARTAPPSAA